MNISNTLFEFTSQIVAQAAADDALENAQIHADVYEEIATGKTIRVDDLRSCRLALVPSANGFGVRRDNALINIFFIVMPATQKLTDRLAAREMSEQMADEWFLKVFDDLILQSRFCAIKEVRQFNDWIKPAGIKMPVCVLRLLINPQNDG